jgi:hypothetical protein
MSHKTEVIRAIETDAAIAVTIRCCDNPKTDSVLTVHGVHKLTVEQLEAEVIKHHDRVASKHDAMGKAKDHISKLTVRVKTHGE